jgi:hypothetical protein
MSPSHTHNDQVGLPFQSKLDGLLVGLADAYGCLRLAVFARVDGNSESCGGSVNTPSTKKPGTLRGRSKLRANWK